MGAGDGAGCMTEALPLLSHAGVELRPLAEADREALRAACAEDREIWQIYSFSMLGDAFDDWWVRHIQPGAGWRMFTIHSEGRLTGMTGYAPDARHPGVVEVGSTYLAPPARGTAVNRIAKWLILSHLFGSGVHRVEFRVDDRNARSQAAVLKLGAKREGVLRRHKLTHTGFLRDTHVFALTDQDWPETEARLHP